VDKKKAIEGVKLVQKVTRFRVKEKYFAGVGNIDSLLVESAGVDKSSQLVLGRIRLPEGISKETFRKFLEYSLNGGSPAV